MIQPLSISALEKIIVPLGTFSDTSRLAELFDSMTGFDSMRTFEVFDAKKGSIWRVLHDSGELLLVGLGDTPDTRTVYKSLREFSFKNMNLLSEEVGLFVDEALLGTVPQPESRSASKASVKRITDLETFTEVCVNGILAGTYRLDQRNSDENRHPLTSITLLYNDSDDQEIDLDSLELACESGLILADAQKTAMQLVNIPSNWQSPQQFTDVALESAGKWGYDCEVYDENRLKNEGFELLLAVNRGSEHPARFLVLRYSGNAENQPHYGFVGKGVTYDTGGLSIKPSESMVWMKCDMAGAATVLAATEAAARLKLPVRLTTVIPLTDNLVDSKSIKPGDIIDSYNGKTVEIADTDAEGRLILADALSWMVRNTDVAHIVDLATLTGATVRTFGPHAAGLFSNCEDLQQRLMSAGDESGERLWPLPLWDEYTSELHSDVADVRNLSGKPTAGAIAAAKFLETFIEDHASWAHLDIAGTVFGDTEFGKLKNATGYGVRLLVTLLQNKS
ncbi:MAG: leucyl aminopeptidase family protein [Balneolales bacterium]|nr:leucyl aminopeptidase family protein [Balneolales bacterium]